MKTLTSSKSEIQPVSLAEAKTHLRLVTSDLDANVSLALNGAVAYVEDRLSRSLRPTETVVQTYEGWPLGEVQFDRQPVLAITSVKYYDSDNTLQTVDSSLYRLLSSTRGATVLELDATDFTYPDYYARDDAVQITYTAGYAADSNNIPQVPPQAKWAILLVLERDWGDVAPAKMEALSRAADSLLVSCQWGAYR